MKENIVIMDEKDRKKFQVKKFMVKAIVMTPMEYILRRHDGKYYNVFNFSTDLTYQGIGYYVSLLAEARMDKVFPDVVTIQDLKDKKMQSLYSDNIFDLAQAKLKKLKGDQFELSVYLGKNLTEKYNRLAWDLYRIFRAPMFRVSFEKKDDWLIKKIKILNIGELTPIHLEFFNQRLNEYFSRGIQVRAAKNEYKYDLAILIDQEEISPPSDQRAIKKFVKAGRKIGLNCEIIEYKKNPNIFEYDALFIRETTNVSHHTYRLARRAQMEGMAVIDDPTSILRCTNKVYLEQLMQRLDIKRPKSRVFDEKTFSKECREVLLPCVLKKPDSAFSQGVYKAKTFEELKRFSQKIFNLSELMLVQEFLPTDFDWRVGVLNNEVLYVCKYYMAQGHWQIINNQEGKKSQEGAYECLPPDQVDKKIVNTALKLCRYIGNGLYGVDLKQKDGDIYVIEVNDNPSIEAGVEDRLLGDKLYEKIMERFLNMCQEKRKIYDKTQL